MAALKLLSAWSPLYASARLTGGVWSKVKRQRRRPRAGRTQTKPRVVRAFSPLPAPTLSNLGVSIRGAVSGAPGRADACLASLLLRLTAFALFCSRFPLPGETDVGARGESERGQGGVWQRRRALQGSLASSKARILPASISPSWAASWEGALAEGRVRVTAAGDRVAPRGGDFGAG